jgi:hypothetical protein
MNEAPARDLTLREPSAVEIRRVLYLFQHLPPPPEAWLLVGERVAPIRRFVAASAAWMKGGLGQFRLACQPGVARRAVAGPFLEHIEQTARNLGAPTVEYADLLADENEWCSILQEHGFECLRSERFFEVSTVTAYERVMRLAANYQAGVPKSWRTESIGQHSPEAVWGMISRHRLLPLADLQQYWRTDSPFGFDQELSAILFDGPQPIGTLLWRRSPRAYLLDVRVVTCENRRLRALGNLCLFLHAAQRGDPEGPIRWMQFRGGETEHRETANLALRMGGQELPPRRILGKRL